MAEKKIKMADLLQFFAFYVNNLTLWARHDNLQKVFHISSSILLCMLLICTSWTSSIVAEKIQWPINCDFLHFTSII